jgi:hypothetical protein
VAPIADFRPDVPPALDQAIRRCLERDPAMRYASAVDMASALEAALHGEEPGTAAWQTGSTQMLAGEDATQALPRTSHLPRQEQSHAPPARARERAPEPRREKRDGAARARLVALGLVLLLAAVAVALLLSQSGGGGYTDIDAGNSRDQAEELIDYVRDHTK